MMPQAFASIGMIALLAIANSPASAQSRRVIDYRYDEAGNLIQIESIVSENPPSITNISPPAVRVASSTNVTVSGADLRLVEVVAADPAVILRNVVSTADTVTFQVTANDAAIIGPSDLTFTTRLGSTIAQLSVQPRLPVIRVSPSPLAMAVGESVPLVVRLSSADIFDHTLTFTVDDTSIADAPVAAVTIASLSTDAPIPIEILAKQLGITALRVTAPGLADFTTPIFVTDLFTPPLGPNDVFAHGIGVLRVPADPNPELIVNGPFGGELRVFKEPGPAAPVEVPLFVISPVLGAIRGGSAIETIDPNAFIRGSGPVAVVVTGTGLDAVTNAGVSPADDVAVSNFAAAPDGITATLTLEATGQALAGIRQLVLETAAGRVPAVSPTAHRIHIARMAPVLTSVAPSVITLNTPSAVLTIRGTDLGPIEAVAISPSNGIVLSAPEVSEDGMTVTVGIAVAEDATLGEHIVTVGTPVGVSDATPSPQNTIAIVIGPATDLSPIAAARLGVVKTGVPGTQFSVDALVSPAVGITRGPVVTNLDPPSGIIDTALTLVLEGSELDAVDDVAFVPEDGLTIGSPTPSPDGRSVSLAVAIAADALQTLRQVRVFSGGIEVLFSSAGADRFAVTAPVPLIRAISPNFVVAGEPPVELTVLGENFDNALSVTVLPPDGIHLSAPVSSVDGESLTVTLSADTGASVGDRVVVVTTPAGATRPAATVANTLAVVAAVVQDISPVIAPLVGIDKSSADIPPTESGALVVSPLIGVRKVEIPPDAGSRDLTVVNPSLGVTLGSSASGLVPSAVPVDTSVELVIRGVGLQDVSDVEFVPSDGITLDAAPIALPDGSEVRVPITVSPDAPLTLRDVIVMTPLDEVRFARAEAGRLKIAAGVPSIDSIEPIQQVPGARFTLIVRGSNLHDAFNVLAEPGSGVNIGSNITMNSDGTELSVDMSVDDGAPIDDHVIRVDTPAGITTPLFGPENTFSVVVQ